MYSEIKTKATPVMLMLNVTEQHLLVGSPVVRRHSMVEVVTGETLMPCCLLKTAVAPTFSY